MPDRGGRKPTDEATRTLTNRRSGPVLTPDGIVVTVIGEGEARSVRIPGKIDKAVTLGTAKENDLVVDDAMVSRRHASFTRTAEGIVVRDLGSKNGIHIAGARVREAVVEAGTIVVAGKTEILVRMELEGAVIPPSASDRFGLALGRGIEMRRIFGVLEGFAPTNATIVLEGETGTGKDVLARSIHQKSKRASGPFEIVDCGAVVPTLIESELLGHERGAFTGAEAARAGAFERASGGTLFLDELGEMPLDVQPKLLRALEARQVKRVGGSKVIDVDVRVIAATTRDLKAEVDRGTFRNDLYFRLAVVPLVVPPLRSRLSDVELLANAILEAQGHALRLAPAAIAALRSHDWPGNVRELRNVLERAAHMAVAGGADVIEEIFFGQPAVERRLTAPPDPTELATGETYRDARARIEARFEEGFVRKLLERHGGNISAAAREAKMDRKYLGMLVKKYALRN